MTNKSKLKDRARDELFSHINRCGVLEAADDDQTHWMEETMEYLAERYPDLSDSDLQELFTLGIRFCRPAIPHGQPGSGDAESEATDEEASAAEAPPQKAVAATEDQNAA